MIKIYINDKSDYATVVLSWSH